MTFEELDRALYAAAVGAYKLKRYDEAWRIAEFQISKSPAQLKLRDMALRKMLGRDPDHVRAEDYDDDEGD